MIKLTVINRKRVNDRCLTECVRLYEKRIPISRYGFLKLLYEFKKTKKKTNCDQTDAPNDFYINNTSQEVNDNNGIIIEVINEEKKS